MEPNFYENDIIICKRIYNDKEMKNGKVFIVYHDDKLMVKRIKKLKSAIADDWKLSLISDNYTEHYPIEITPNSKTKFYELVIQLKQY